MDEMYNFGELYTYAIGLTVLDPTELTGEMIDKLTSEVVRIYG